MRTRQALRTLRARQIIRKAYGIRRDDGRYARVRFELLGDSVAIAVVRDRADAPTVAVKAARQLPDGRVQRMLKENRRGFENLKEQILYFEALYERYGSPVVNVRCTGCGRRDVAIETFRCTWPDERITVERHCVDCQRTWQRQLRALGARLEPVSGGPSSPPGDDRL